MNAKRKTNDGRDRMNWGRWGIPKRGVGEGVCGLVHESYNLNVVLVLNGCCMKHFGTSIVGIQEWL